MPLLRSIDNLLIIELIDTLWNVNENRGDFPHHRLPELIDTLWNVNLNAVNTLTIAVMN